MAARQSLASKISDIPAGAQISIKRGLYVLSGLSVGQRGEYTDKVIDASLAGRSFVDLGEFTEDFDIDVSSARDATNAVSILVGLLSDSDEDLEKFLDVTSEKIYNPEQKDLVRELARITISKRNEIAKSLSRASLAAETLPSLRGLSLTVDLRPKFERGAIVDAVGVGILHLETDSRSEIWVQITKSDIRYIQNALSNASAEIELAEALFIKSEND